MKGKIVEPEFEEGKEKEPQNVAIMEKFKDSEINAMSIIVDSIKDHLIPYISHLDSSKKDVRCPNKHLLSQKHWTSNKPEE